MINYTKIYGVIGKVLSGCAFAIGGFLVGGMYLAIPGFLAGALLGHVMEKAVLNPSLE